MKKQDTNKRAEQIADAIGELPEQMICDALDFEGIKKKQKRKRKHRIEVFSGLAAAAVISIVVLYGSDRSFLQRQTADIDKTQEKTALKGSDQLRTASEEELDIWCMASEMGEDVTQYAYSDNQSPSSENADEKKESGTDSQKESRRKTKDEGKASVSGNNTADNDSDFAGDEVDDAKSAKSDSNSATGETRQNGEPLLAGERQLLYTNITGEGKDKKVQFTLQFGETDDQISYELKASGVSMELIAENYKAHNKISLQGNRKSKVICASGTQIGCSLRVTDIVDKTVSPSISVTKENKDTGEKIKGKIKVEQKNGKYYLYLMEK